MTRQEASVLGAQPFLRGLPPAQLGELAGICEHVTVPAGWRLFDEGSTAGRFWIIDAGQVTLDASVPGRGRVIIETLGRNDVIGLSWMLPPYQWRVWAGAAQPTPATSFAARPRGPGLRPHHTTQSCGGLYRCGARRRPPHDVPGPLLRPAAAPPLRGPAPCRGCSR